MENQSPRLLLVKAGEFKHSGQYYLLNGRWHKLHADKPAPKGAPVAAHPKAAGHHAPAKHFTDDEWGKLHLPAENSNAGSYNKQLHQLKQHSESGDVTAILGSQYGTNTYGKKAATVANHLLKLHGSQHQVKPGQKAGDHEAVKAPPAEPQQPAEPVVAPEPAKDAPAPATPEPAQSETSLTMPSFQEGKMVSGVVDYYENLADKLIMLAEAGNVASLEAIKSAGLQPNSKGKISNTFAGKTTNSKKLLALHAQALEHAKGVPGQEPVKNAEPAAATVSAPEPAPAPEPIKKDPASAADGHFDMASQHAAAAQQATQSGSHAAAKAHGDAATVHTLAGKSHKGGFQDKDSLSAYAKEQSEKANKTKWKSGAQSVAVATTPAPVKKEPRLVLPKAPPPPPEVKPEPVAATPPAPVPDSNVTAPSNLDSIPWDGLKLPDSNSNAKSHNGKIEHIKKMAYAGDLAGLEAFQAGKNTYGKKQNQIAQVAIAALKEGAPADNTKQAVAAFANAGKPSAAVPDVLPHEEAEIIHLLATGQGSQAITALYHSLTPDQKSYLADKASAKLENEKKPPAKPDVSPSMTWKEAVDEIETAINAGDEQALQTMLANTEGLGAEGAQKAHAYAAAGLKHLGVESSSLGPKDGDTKQGADGTLMFMDGHWHKVEQPKAAPAPTRVETTYSKIKASEVISIGKGYKTAAGNKAKVKAFAVAGDGAGLKEFIDKLPPGLPATKKLATDVLAAMASAPPEGVAATKKKAAAPAAPPPPKPAAPVIEAMDNWEQIGAQAGSNPGGKFKDSAGVEWYCKFPADEDMAKSEVLATKLYAALGVTGQDSKLITKDGKIGIASRWTDVKKAGPKELAKIDGVYSGFAADAWIGNWDAVGLEYDNLQIGADGKAYRVDAGGSLTYRAQGAKKAFGNVVTELDSLRDPAINKQSAAVFGKMSKADITASVAKIVNLPDASIRAICYTHGPGDIANRKALADTLIARKNDLQAKFPKAGKAPKKRLDPNNLPVDSSQLPKRHDFSNWNSAGQGLSSQPHVNAANHAVEQEILELAKTGNLSKLKEFQYHEIDKATGNATGTTHPIKNHPSKHVIQFHADIVQLLDEIANPPEPLKHFVEAEVGTLEALDAAFPPKPLGTTVNSVKSNEKMGFWVVLGGVAGSDKFKPAKVMDFSKDAIASAYDKYKQAKPLAKHFINSVQSSGSYNDLFRAGKETDGSGNKLTDVAQAALEQATSQPEGTSVYRWQNMSDDMVKKIIGAPDGTVFQATGPMCTSYSPTSTQGFGPHRVTIRYAEGAKGVDSFGSGKFAGEKEVTTLPNSRFVILSKKMVPSEKTQSKQRLELEVLMLPPDIGLDGKIM